MFEWGGFIISISGIWLCWHIYSRKKRKSQFICPLGFDCKDVTKSAYANVLGIPLEFFGLVFYLSCAILFILFSFGMVSQITLFFLLIIISFALLFSFYLLFIQLVVLKKACSWCLLSLVFVSLLFILIYLFAQLQIISLLQQYKLALVTGHLIGVAFGVGGATITDLLFFKFLRDLRISKWEANVLHTVSQMIWLGLAFLVLTGIGLFFTNIEGYSVSGKFLAKMIIVGVIIVNGTLLNLIITPKLIHITFGEKHHHKKGELHYLRKLAFALGAISFTSWYTALILGSIPGSLGLQLYPILGVYVCILIGAISGSQILEKNISWLKH